MTRPPVDLRSDTVTKPTAHMRDFMARAPVGDDVFGEDPTVNQLESEAAALFGQESALFLPTGTMANQICLRLLIAPGGELWCESDAHILRHEQGAAARYGGISTLTMDGDLGALRPADVAARLADRQPAQFPAAIAAEVSHNRAGGTVPPVSTLRELRELTGGAGIAMHCDGARIWNASVATGVALADYGQLFDTLSVCTSKGLGAPVGSLLVAGKDLVRRARAIRKSLGGGMRQAGIIAAGALYGIRHHRDRLVEDHALARRLAAALVPYCDPQAVHTNIVLVHTGLDAPATARLAAAAKARGVLAGHLAGGTLRLVTHLDVDESDIDFAAGVLSRLLADKEGTT